jgi:hypothetical protein
VQLKRNLQSEVSTSRTTLFVLKRNEKDSTLDEPMQETAEDSTNVMNVDSPNETDLPVNAIMEKENKQQEEEMQVENKAQEEELETSKDVGQDYTPIVESNAERVARQQLLRDILDILVR